MSFFLVLDIVGAEGVVNELSWLLYNRNTRKIAARKSLVVKVGMLGEATGGLIQAINDVGECSIIVVTTSLESVTDTLLPVAASEGVDLGSNFSSVVVLPSCFADHHQDHSNTASLDTMLQGYAFSKVISVGEFTNPHQTSSPTVSDPDSPMHSTNQKTVEKKNEDEEENDKEEGEKEDGDSNTSTTRFIRLRGLPWGVTQDEILKFFEKGDVTPMEVLEVLGHGGRKTGEAYAEFESVGDAQKGLDLHRKHMGSRYIEIFKSSEEDMARARERNTSRDEKEAVEALVGYGYAVKLRGLPFSATAEDVLDFLEIEGLKKEAVHFMVGRNKRVTGEAYVELPTVNDETNALKQNRKEIGSRYVEVFRTSVSAMRSLLGLPSAQALSSIDPNATETILKLRGLPFRVSEAEVKDFLRSEGRCRAAAVHIMTNHRGLPSGEALVDVESQEEIDKGLNCNKKNIGSRYIEVFTVPRRDLVHWLESQSRPVAGRRGESMYRSSSSYSRRPEPYPSQSSRGYRGHGRGEYPRRPDPYPRDMGYEAHRAYYEDPYAYGGYDYGYGGAGYGEYYSAGAYGQYDGYYEPQGYPPPAAVRRHSHEETSTSGARFTVQMRGLPYSATAGDVEDFCKGFRVSRDAIRIGKGRDGRPSGQAWVTFPSTEAAEHFVAERNRSHMQNRYIELFLV